MKKRYIIHDEDGAEYKVEETLVTEKDEDIEEVEEVKEVGDGNDLTEEEIAALKRLASVADKLIGMVGTTNDEDEEAEEVLERKEEEEVIDTDEYRKTCDSKASFNSIERSSKKVDDSVDPDSEVNAAWMKRYNGGK